MGSSSSKPVISGNKELIEEERRLEEAKSRIKKHGSIDVDDFIQDIDDVDMIHQIESWINKEIHIAITGESGTRKSSFINAVRGLKGYDAGAAPVGTTETTKKPTPYSHPNYKNIIFWDLPGIGTPTFPNLETYCKEIGDLEKYDIFLIFCKSRFTQHDKELAEKVSKLSKPFFFVRTNVDTELKNAEDDKGSNFDKASVMKGMRENCLENLEDLVDNEKFLFLIDNKVLREDCDFDRLIRSITSELPAYKRECFILSLSNVTRESIQRKAKLLKVRATVMTGVAACVSIVPYHGVVRGFNITSVLEEMTYYENKFGLSGKVTDKFKVLDEEASALFSWDMNSEQKFPMLSASLSYFNVHNFLSNYINDLEKVALDIWDATVKSCSK
ncbi:interferon-inducible GTPase 1-like [Xenia sp. Carnegie-2017]|uniref:interferon-inducible GTPase 1-like n=1 Tax=Xenia sp. Carnegie-2017 TaxID=2897299 RepID=UPI001F04EDB2|nr:interferon-inducible GTPase 1-like [Xenia sp. Carnegie-2017]